MFRSVYVFALLLLVATAVSACGTPATAENPAATVNGTDVPMSAYNKELNYQLVQQEASLGLNPCQAKGLGPVCLSVKKTALDTLIDNVLVQDYAAKHNIVVSPAAIQRQWAIVYRQDFHDQRAVLQAYAKRYGLTPADVKQRTADQMLQDAVMISLTRSMPLQAPALRLSKIDVKTQSDANAIKAALSSGQSFATIAAKLNKTSKSLCSKTGCGDTGWLPAAFIPGGDHQVVTAKVGSVVGPFQSQQLFEFIQVTGRDQRYTLTAQQILRFRQQKLIAWLAAQQKKADIKRNVSV